MKYYYVKSYLSYRHIDYMYTERPSIWNEFNKNMKYVTSFQYNKIICWHTWVKVYSITFEEIVLLEGIKISVPIHPIRKVDKRIKKKKTNRNFAYLGKEYETAISFRGHRKPII